MKLIQKLIILLLLFNKLSAQITVSHPLNSAVYQRNSANQANLVISGTYSQPLATSIQARLLNTTNGSAIPGFDWSVIQENPSMGYFQGQLNNVPAGWYTLEIRSVRSGVTLEANVVNRVGIGDVFMIAGQSNAQGYIDNQYLGATSEKVVSHNNGKYCSNMEIPFPVFQQLTGTVKPSVNGRDAWCYGRLGDNLVNSTGYPVAFFNSGASGASVYNWRQSADGFSTIHALTDVPFCSLEEENSDNPNYVEGQPSTYANTNPYFIFKRGLNYYNSMFGARSVLWHQGESDTDNGTSTPSYQNDLTYVINKSRTDFANNLPWVVSRVSYFLGNFSSNVINAQNNVITNTSQVFAGPETDNIRNGVLSGSRGGDDVHFWAPVGLSALADAWSSYLNSSFFTNSNPIAANTPPNITVSYINSSQVNLIVPGGYSSYKWVSGDFSYGSTSYGSSNTLTASSGTYRCWVTTANGNQQISSQVNVNQALVLASNGTSCTTNAYLSDLKFVSATNGLGPIELYKSNGTGADGDGGTIMLKGQNYPKGIGVADNSEIKYIIPTNQYYKFRSYVGISDDVSNACDNTGGVVFKVYGNETLLYTSPTIYRNTALQEINVNVYPYSSIKLKVEAIGSNTTCNRAVWADARLLCSSGDTTAPTVVTNLVATDTLTKCLSFQWTHATDDQAVGGYYIYKNGIIIDTIPNTQNTFTLTSLTPSTSVVFGVKAFDVVNNQSALVTKTLSTVNLNFDYVQSYPFLCVNRSYLPINVSPSGGVFAQTEGPSASVNPSSGEFFSSNITANVNDAYQYFYIRYRVGESIPGCMHDTTRVLGVTTQPTITPSITADKDLINQGTVVNFTSTACDVNSTINWSFTAPNSTNVQFLPSSTGTYFAYCAKLQCYVYSNNVTVNLLPNCSNSLVLAPTANNLTSRPNALSFNSSNTISANNTISPTNNVQYNAANSILLSPGFSVNSGVIFSAKIQNCPN